MDERAPFVDLPALLVEEVLEKASDVGNELCENLRCLKEERAEYRQVLLDRGLILHESSFDYPPLPTTCGVDGSYAIERLLTVDLTAAAAVAVEGLTPPSEKRHWEQPHHMTFVVSEVHHAETATVLRAVMLGNELVLATKAPHDLVLIDGTLTMPIIYFNQALNLVQSTPELRCAQEFQEHWEDYLRAYLTLLRAERSDKSYVSLPKYSTRREIGRSLEWPGEHDDRGFLTLLLQAGELTRPLPLEQPEQEWHLNWRGVPDRQERARELATEIVNALGQVYVFYYKPHVWIPAIRVEVAREIAMNPYRLGTVIQGLKHQCATPAMLEPYPVNFADRTVKALARAIPSFRQVATQRIAERYEGDIGEVFFAMHGYRSEMGGS
jgi:hypothetical protein